MQEIKLKIKRFLAKYGIGISLRNETNMRGRVVSLRCGNCGRLHYTFTRSKCCAVDCDCTSSEKNKGKFSTTNY